MKSRRVVVISDTHCGSLVGLTHPRWQTKKDQKREHWGKIQKECWSAFDKLLRSLAPFHVLLVNGDCIDGTGHRSGGTEQITTDREEQADMAVAITDHARLVCGAKSLKIAGTYGTGYHVGDAEDFENIVASRGKWDKIGGHEWYDVNGFVFDMKHHLGSSGIPHGRFTAIARDALWATLWAEKGVRPNPDCIIRSHVHYHGHIGAPGYLAMTTPALQAMGTKYGERRCNGIVDWGLIHFDVDGKGNLEDWQAHTMQIEAQRSEPHVL
jgi:hypothetical protein